MANHIRGLNRELDQGFGWWADATTATSRQAKHLMKDVGLCGPGVLYTHMGISPAAPLVLALPGVGIDQTDMQHMSRASAHLKTAEHERQTVH